MPGSFEPDQEPDSDPVGHLEEEGIQKRDGGEEEDGKEVEELSSSDAVHERPGSCYKWETHCETDEPRRDDPMSSRMTGEEVHGDPVNRIYRKKETAAEPAEKTAAQGRPKKKEEPLLRDGDDSGDGSEAEPNNSRRWLLKYKNRVSKSSENCGNTKRLASSTPGVGCNAAREARRDKL